MLRILLALALAFLALPAFAASPEVALVAALNNARRGAVVPVPAGTYDLADLAIRRSVTLRGEGDVVFAPTRSVRKGILVPAEGVSLRVENITFRGAAAPDLNGAGIRHEGLDLVVVGCVFEDDENGILATGSDFGNIRIENSVFRNNGHGDGYSHGVYVASAASLVVEGSRFLGTRIGHHVKSLAETTRVEESVFDDAGGRTSYALDASRGGAVVFARNLVFKSADADNESIVNYDLSRGGKAKSLGVVANRIVSRNPRGRLLRNDTRLAPVVENNVFVEERGGRILDADRNVMRADGATAPAILPAPAPAAPTGPAVKGAAAAPSVFGPFSVEAPFPAPSARTGLLKAPVFAAAPDALARLKLQNPWPRATQAGVVTFGQVFAKGALKPAEPLDLVVGDARSPAQVDVKSLYADGSVLFAAVSVAAPALKPGAVVEARLVRAAIVDRGRAPVAAGLSLPVTVTFRDGGAPRSVTVDAGALAAEQLARGASLWLDGGLAREARVEKALAPHLLLRVDARVLAGGAARVSLAFSNEKTFSPGARDLVYDVAVGPAGAPVWRVADVRQHRASVWRKVFVSGPAPQLHVVRDLSPFIASGALPPFDVGVGASAAAIADLYAAGVAETPLSSANVLKYFPTTGGRPDIGIAPQWTALALVAQTPAAFATMRADAEAAGAVPWHMRDEKTGRFVSLVDRPRFWAEPRGLEDAYAPDRPHADLFAGSDGGWAPDLAHAPSLAAVPFLLTADRHYADELAAQAAWMLYGRGPSVRRGGLVTTDVEQVRDTAWALRDLSDAAFLLPDADPTKAYFRRALADNLAAMKAKYVDGRARRGAGALEGALDREEDGAPPIVVKAWQNDYVALALAGAARRGSSDARALLAWSAPFHAGRFLAGDLGPARGAAYLFHARDAAGRPLTTWPAIAAATFGPGAEPMDGADGYPTLAGGYVGSAAAALAAIASETGRADAFVALAALMRARSGDPLWSPAARDGVAASPNFLFTLALPGGARVGRDAMGALPDPRRASFAWGTDRGDVLRAGPFADALFGGAGDDDVDGGGGANVLSGGSGGDVFRVGAGADRILDFDPDTDRLSAPQFAGEGAARLAAGAKTTADGARIDFGDGAYVILEHVDAARLRVANLLAAR